MTVHFRKEIIRWTAAVLLTLAVVYPLSYAPVVWWEVRDFKRYEAENGFIILGEPMVDGFLIPLYRPIDWLIDNTPLDKPMFAWARLWGVEAEFESAALDRELIRCWLSQKYGGSLQ